jgi:hypothetical protein
MKDFSREIEDRRRKDYWRARSRAMVRAGKIKRERCHVCSSVWVQMHHLSYNDNFEIVWLCTYHHDAIHRAINKAARLET